MREFLTQEQLNEIDKNKQDGLYPDYLIYDEFGLKQVLCMICGIPIKERVKIDEAFFIKVLPNFRQIKIDLSDGSYIQPMVCDKCEHKQIDPNRLMAQINHGWAKEMRQKQRPDADIKRYLDGKKNLKIKKRQKNV